MGKINIYDKIMIENRQKGKIWKSKKFLHKSPSKSSFTNGIHSSLKRADARESADVIYLPEKAVTSFTLYVSHIASLRVKHSY